MESVMKENPFVLAFAVLFFAFVCLWAGSKIGEKSVTCTRITAV
jgi:hypothetical protein